jgi:hypothetical protein
MLELEGRSSFVLCIISYHMIANQALVSCLDVSNKVSSCRDVE